METFKLQQIKKSFFIEDREEVILKNIDLSLNKGELTALVGASGSGKSTLLTIAAGLQQATDGQILFENQDLAKLSAEQIRAIRAKKFGFVFQFSHLVPFLTVEDQLTLMLDVADKKINKAEVTRVLQLVGMDHRKNAYPSSLSGGEKQRVAIARAIIHQPEILFADEPTASLDSKKTEDIMALLQTLTKELNLTTLLVTHDQEVLHFVDNIVTMQDGEIIQTPVQS
ncbi:ABC transporter ATP-binding protein [Solibacillus sp. MA9]|uniref:ABC transporter ATP-binding protein n=1 Tax=Solibacillus palustris TaxID=2908203 RepID=A0ABS9UG71_9BACL|nr:ABC transporter ATP-binding protein [Solibacillus sp. MA9]